MKKLILTILTIALFALGLGLEAPPAEADDFGPWRLIHYDSIAAASASTTLVYLGALHRGAAQVFGFVYNSLTGATDGAWIFEVPVRRRQGGTPKYWETVEVMREGTAGSETLAISNNQEFFHLGMHISADNESNIYGISVFGDMLRVRWDEGSVTGGYAMIWLYARTMR